tara:strand:- start:918 stop:1994 length:1077 start_codon:yes stop_codon:yes gene_type:complete
MSQIKILRSLSNINGKNDLGNNYIFWFFFFLLLLLGLFSPLILSRYQLLNLSNHITNIFLGLSLCLIWGYCGILSLGQSLFLGLGGYTYGIVGINLIETHGNTHVALLMGIIVPIFTAFVLGYLMFFARLKGVYVAILMLVVSLLFETFLNQTAGPGWFVGEAHLGGNNGLGRFSGVTREPPSLIFSFRENTIEFVGSSIQFYYLCFGLALITFLALRLLVNSSFGYKMIAIREDIDRTEALGHNIKLIQLIIFCVGAGLASMSGILYVSWGNFITPDTFGVYNNILPVIWVAVAGRKSLTAALLGSFFISWISQWLNEQGDYALVALGAILLSSMLFAPEGVIVKITQKFSVKLSKQ